MIIDTVNMMVMTARHIVEATTDYDHMDSIAWVWIYMNRSDGASIRTMRVEGNPECQQRFPQSFTLHLVDVLFVLR